jgi:hypothetical protein
MIGDTIPQSTGGKIVAMIAALSSVYILALPIGIIATNFTESVQNRKRKKQAIKLFKQNIRI